MISASEIFFFSFNWHLAHLLQACNEWNSYTGSVVLYSRTHRFSFSGGHRGHSRTLTACA